MFPEMDLRDHKVSCADATTQAFDRLAVKDGFVLVADHGPAALRYVFEAERAGQFGWESLAGTGNGIWPARVRRIAPAPGTAS
jgi:uncharacterized protein (DUF2249 family)